MTDQQLMTTSEAIAALAINRQTLYAYVSRGLIRSEGGPGRERRYRAADIDALRERKARGRGAAAVATQTLNFGTPVLDSALTAITADGLYYRGRDACALAGTATLEDTARLLWNCEINPFDSADSPAVPDALRRAWLAAESLPFVDRCLALLPVAASRDPRAWNSDPAATTAAAARVLRLLTAILAGRPPSPLPMHHQLAAAWALDGDGADLARAALVLSADHELNASTFAVRIAASTGVTPWGATVAGLAVLQGPLHGGMTRRVSALLDSLAGEADLEAAIAERVQSGARVPGFGHRLYPDGDVRARFLLDRLSHRLGDHPETKRIEQLVVAVAKVLGQKPTIDVATVAIERACGMPRGAALALFLLGRAAGWLAHWMEQRDGAQVIRPRARYVGVAPPAR